MNNPTYHFRLEWQLDRSGTPGVHRSFVPFSAQLPPHGDLNE